MLHSEVVGQRPNLTSGYLRAFRFAKRCLGSRSGFLFDGLCVDPHPSLATAAQTLRSAPLARVVAETYPSPRRGRRPQRPEPPSIVKKTDSHVQCAHWPRNDRNPLSLRGGPGPTQQSASPVPKAPLWKGGRLRAPPVAEEASKKEWQRSKFCERMRAKYFGYRNRSCQPQAD